MRPQLRKTITEIMWLPGEALTSPCQAQRLNSTRHRGSACRFVEVRHPDKDWKGIWENEIYGISWCMVFWASFSVSLF